MKVIVLFSYTPFYQEASSQVEAVYAHTPENLKAINDWIEESEKKTSDIELSYNRMEDHYHDSIISHEEYCNSKAYKDYVERKSYYICEPVVHENVGDLPPIGCGCHG